MTGTFIMLGWVAGVMTCVVMQALHKAVAPREKRKPSRHRIRRTLRWLTENAHRSMQNDPIGVSDAHEAEAL